MNKLNVILESKITEKDPNISGIALSYLDSIKIGNGVVPIMAIAASENSNPEVCITILNHIKQVMTSDFFTRNIKREYFHEEEMLHSKIMTLFIEANGKLPILKRKYNDVAASLGVGLLLNNYLYFGISGDINILLQRDSVLYNLNLKDDIFKQIKENPYRANNKQKLGTGIIPQVNTYRIKIESGDKLFMQSSIFSEHIEDATLIQKLVNSEDCTISNMIMELLKKGAPTKAAAMLSIFCYECGEPIEQSGNIIAELPPEYPPAISGENIELKRSENDYYNQSKKSKSESKIKIEKPTNSAKKPFLIFLVSLLLTLAIGGVWLFNSQVIQPVYSSEWSIKSDVNCKIYKDKTESVKKHLSFISRSDNNETFVITPKKMFYDLKITVTAASPIHFESNQSLDSIEQNKITLLKDKIIIETNMISLTNGVKIAERSKDGDGKSVYTTVLKITKLKGATIVKNESMRALKLLNISIQTQAPEVREMK